jgi:hypothetical protein
MRILRCVGRVEWLLWEWLMLAGPALAQYCRHRRAVSYHSRVVSATSIPPLAPLSRTDCRIVYRHGPMLRYLTSFGYPRDVLLGTSRANSR